jgi:hypothetical protein
MRVLPFLIKLLLFIKKYIYPASSCLDAVRECCTKYKRLLFAAIKLKKLIKGEPKSIE